MRTTLKTSSTTFIFMVVFLTAITSVTKAGAATQAFNYVETKHSGESNRLHKAISFNKATAKMDVGEAVAVPLPNGEQLVFTINSRQSVAGGDTVIMATDQTDNQLILTVGKKAVFGSVFGSQHSYTVGYAPDEGQFIIDQKSAELPDIDFGDDGVVGPDFKTMSELGITSKSAIPSKSGSEITLLALYSPEFAAAFGNAATRINQMIAFTNNAYARSGILISLKLARAQQLNFDNAPGTSREQSNSLLLARVRAASDGFQSVPQLRNTYGADLVAVFRFEAGNVSSGLADVNGSNPNRVFSVNQFSANCCDSVFAHEIGHNLGSGHERDANPPNRDFCGRFNFTGYSCGYGDSSEGWGTIMARSGSRNAGFVFSDPSSNSCPGNVACGVAAGQPGAADNRASFNIARSLVANFRADPPTNLPPVDSGAESMPAIIPLLLDDEAD